MIPDFIQHYIKAFLSWGTSPHILPYALAFIIFAMGFVLMWAKSQWATIPHELGHAIVALILGRKLSGIDINKDSTGVTKSADYRHKNVVIDFFMTPIRWVRGILTSFAGYPAPFLLSLCLCYFWSKQQSKFGILLMVILLIIAFLYSTNMFGFLLILAGLMIMGLSLWINNPILSEILTVFIAGGMLSGGIKGVWEAWQVYQQDRATSTERWHDPSFEPQHSDARALSRKTLIPQIVWLLVFSILGLFLGFGSLYFLALAAR